MAKPKKKETNDLRGGLTHRVTLDPYDRTGAIGEAKAPPRAQQGLMGDAFKPRAKDVLSSRFILPPFSVLNTREGFWQDRKKQWIGIGIQSELGRGHTMDAAALNTGVGTGGGGMSKRVAANFKEAIPEGAGKNAVYRDKGRQLTRQSGKDIYLHAKGDDDETVLGGTSVFDPVLCELVYRWFSPPAGRVLDPFAGGSVRGVVAGELGLHYVGIDLSGRQLEANRKQAAEIGTLPRPTWLQGDSANLKQALLGPAAKVVPFDLLFSCPPYGNLEVYSDHPKDISNMLDDDFDDAYAGIIEQACGFLKDNAFAVFVVGDYRDKKGFFRNFPAKTIAMFEAAGLRLYNELILVTAIGSLPLRVQAGFNGSRKIGKTHQQCLVFAKGDPKEFVPAWGDVF